jgi:hypothetical protein
MAALKAFHDKPKDHKMRHTFSTCACIFAMDFHLPLHMFSQSLRKTETKRDNFKMAAHISMEIHEPFRKTLRFLIKDSYCRLSAAQFLLLRPSKMVRSVLHAKRPLLTAFSKISRLHSVDVRNIKACEEVLAETLPKYHSIHHKSHSLT